jgi:uncharacterized protein (DUF1501 family)
MIRRDFIKNVAPLAFVPFFSNRLFASIPYLSQQDYALLSQMAISDDRIFVIIQMSGGNDGLNTVLPLDQYSNLAAARGNILIPDTSALQLGSYPTGLHPSMVGLKNLYDNQKLSVIQNVSYANQSFSHFRTTDIFTSGSNSNEVIETGWLGRFLEYKYPGFPGAYPNVNEPDPLAITIGSDLSQAFQGYSINTSQAVPSNFSGSLTQLLPYSNTVVPATPAGNEVAYIRNQQLNANAYSARIINAWTLGTNLQTYTAPPAGTSSNLGQQLRIVARLIKGGLKTKLYWVKMGSFDTHATQVVSTDHTTGTHANLLKELSDSIFDFQEDLRLMSLENRVMGMTFSEFGRRIKSNASAGTDHGTSGPVFMFGTNVNPAVIGSNPVIPASVSTGLNLGTEFDYRELYMSVLQNWFCLSSTEAETVLTHNQAPLNTSLAPCDNALTLPVELLSFRVEKLNTVDAHLSWATASEQNTSRFEIERSTDGVSFDYQGKVNAAEHSHELKSYSFVDKNLPIDRYFTFYYRLKMIDLDGQFAYTEIRAIKFDASLELFDFVLSPNPSTDGTFTLHFNQELPENHDIEIFITDLFGRRVAARTINPNGTDYFIDVAKGLPAGNYYISVKNALVNKTVKWLVV